MEKYLKVTIGLFIKWAKEKGVKEEQRYKEALSLIIYIGKITYIWNVEN